MQITEEQAQTLQDVAEGIASKHGVQLKRTLTFSSSMSDDVVVERSSSEIKIRSSQPMPRIAECIERGVLNAAELDEYQARVQREAIEEAEEEAEYWLGFLNRHLTFDEFAETLHAILGRMET